MRTIAPAVCKIAAVGTIPPERTEKAIEKWRALSTGCTWRALKKALGRNVGNPDVSA
jgi:hypothetical protein